MASILVVEDEKDIQRTLRQILEGDGHAVRVAGSAEDAEAELRRAAPELLLLDVRLPGKDGFAFCRGLKASSQWRSIPVIFLTSKLQEAHKVLGFELGADDYITKPFSTLELLARVKAVLKRVSPGSGSTVLSDGRIEVDLAGGALKVDGKAVKVTAKEFRLAALLLEKKGRVLSRSFLMESVWGRDYEATTRTIDQHVYRLRKSLGEAGKKIVWVAAAAGYKWEDED
jgi:DNA-binding response OmpR family regulator